MSFNSLGLHPSLLKALSKQGFTRATPIQAEAIPYIMKGHDLMGISKTGSGKTASYALPILQKLIRDKDLNNKKIKTLIIVPTRELASQVKDMFQELSSELSLRIKTIAVFGGVAINPQMQALLNVHVLIATPGRLLDLHRSNAMKISEINTLVIDEADKLLNLGFKEEMDEILKLLPKKRQNLLFSATLTEDVQTINQLILNQPKVVKIENKEDEKELLIQQVAYLIDEDKKGPLLRYLIKTLSLEKVLVFTSSTRKADNVTEKLNKNGIQAAAIHSKKSQGARQDTLVKFKAGKLRVLVATDLLGRGIDIDQLPHVINYELPRSPKDYIHRIGRTGRAENPGQALSLIAPTEEHHFKVIQKKMGTWAEKISAEEFDLHGF